MTSMAPALALDTAADSGALLRWHVSTPATPRKCAERSAAPKFCCGGWGVGCGVGWGGVGWGWLGMAGDGWGAGGDDAGPRAAAPV